MAQVWDWNRAGAVAEQKGVGGRQLQSRPHRFPRLGPLPLSPNHADLRDGALFVVSSHLSSESAAWLHSPRFTSCGSFSRGRSASPLAHSRPPRGNALRPTLRPSLTRPTRHLRLPMRYGLHPGSRSAVEHGVDSDAPASAAVLPTMARPPPMVRPPLNALVLVLRSRSVPGAAGRSGQQRTGGCLFPSAASHPHPTRYPGTRWAQWAGGVRHAGGALAPPALYRPMKAARSSPFSQTSNLSSPPATILVPERARGTLRTRHDGE
jgi:hypothetical protein